MHIAATKPLYLSKDQVDQDLVAREKEIFVQKSKDSGKPKNVIEKMVEGRIRKFLEDIVLLEQVFVMDNKSKIFEVISNLEKEIGAKVKIADYGLFELGAGIEKEESDFAKEVEEAMQQAISETDALVNEFTVAPQINPKDDQLPFHEWLVEFEKEPSNLSKFIQILDTALQNQNSYYFDLIDGKILQTLKVTAIKKGGFRAYMKSIGKLGGQNKVQRLSNDRKVADVLSLQKLGE
jgi:hypothetical protein